MTDVARTVVLIEDIGSLAAHEKAHELGKRFHLPVFEAKLHKKKKQFSGEQWQLVVTQKGVVLRLSSQPDWGDIFVDFCAASLAYRRQHGGGKKEPLVRAAGLHKQRGQRILDCTAGMGVDSFVLASAGAHVLMIERQYQIAILLEDALKRASEAHLDISEKISLVKADAYEYLSDSPTDYDVIYLDPMFPHKKRSALVKKEMQAFQKLVGGDKDSSKLMSLALNIAKRRVVVKRPNYAAALENSDNRQPDLVVTSKKHRFDVYLINT